MQRLRSAGADYTLEWGNGELYDEAADRITAMEAELVAARRDAERYRWIRANDTRASWPPVHGSMWVVQYHQPPGYHVMPEVRGAGYGTELDAAIDRAALGATEQTGETK